MRAVLTFTGSTLVVRQILEADMRTRLFSSLRPAGDARSMSAMPTFALGEGVVAAWAGGFAMNNVVTTQVNVAAEAARRFFILLFLCRREFSGFDRAPAGRR